MNNAIQNKLNTKNIIKYPIKSKLVLLIPKKIG